MIVNCRKCGEFDEKLLNKDEHLWEIHKYLFSVISYCPKCGTYLHDKSDSKFPIPKDIKYFEYTELPTPTLNLDIKVGTQSILITIRG